jgi:hypothetical protein
MIVLKKQTFNAATADPKSVTVTLQQAGNGLITIHVSVTRYKSSFQLSQRTYQMHQMDDLEHFLLDQTDGYYQLVILQWITRSVNLEVDNI